MSGEASSGGVSEKKRRSRLEIAYGGVGRDGGSLLIRIFKGVKKAKGLGLPEGEDVFVVGVRDVGAVVTTAPRVVTKSNIREVLDQIKHEIDVLAESYDADREKMTSFLLDWAGRKAQRHRMRVLNPKKRRGRT